ncbi:MAG: pyridoxamine 5'-phosphate oxidase family protein [Nitrospinae bacterium]|nr:pyridoxamine 5'-phosphate oxidase family protein [Nitrospinota bacterium]
MQIVLSTAPVGQVGIVDAQGYPRVAPLNFVWHGGKVYFHGAMAGEKFSYFKNAECKVAFSADLPYSSIPSYWIAEKYACPATIFFKSVHIKGKGSVVEDAREKAEALQKLMEKYQPEGGFAPITPDDPLYQKPLAETAVFRIDPEQTEVKSKFAQNRPAEVRRALIAKLEERDRGMDRATADEIRKTLGVSGVSG